ncbi:MAG: nickel-dependent lactate racemase [Spirochaetia bacterium]|jgi:nickel-dependent lactate racemase|nr:nickel-dependent lactate racemase [Spirochaetia bacterium]
MHFDLKYGKGSLPLDLDEKRILKVVMPGEKKPLADALGSVKKVLAAPEGTPPLLDMLKAAKPKKLVIIVNDITRPTPYSVLMPPVVEAIEKAGIPDSCVTLITATGIHDPHTREQDIQVYGEELCRRFKLVSHDATDKSNLVFKGKLPSGYDFWLNKLVDEADFLITLGVVMPHYFAGFSGGRKSILPGVSGKETVEKNHARMVEIMDNLPPIRENPISLEMIQAARSVGVDFIVNAVVDDAGQLVEVVAGDLEKAWYRAVEVSNSMYMTPIPRKTKIAIAASSGYPRDINLYQAQKALDHADKATVDGGTVIVVAECKEGYGEKIFESYMNAGYTAKGIMDKVKANFVIGAHKAYGFAKVAAEKKVIFVTSLSDEVVASLFARKASTVEEAVRMALEDQGSDADFIVFPEGSVTVPYVAS